jgi:hypothetical protein
VTGFQSQEVREQRLELGIKGIAAWTNSGCPFWERGGIDAVPLQNRRYDRGRTDVARGYGSRCWGSRIQESEDIHWITIFELAFLKNLIN